MRTQTNLRVISLFIIVQKVRNEELFQACRRTMYATLKFLAELIKKDEKIGTKIRYRLVTEDGQFRGIAPYATQDNGGFVYNHMDEIQKLDEVKYLKEFLRNLLKNNQQIKSPKSESDYLHTLFYRYCSYPAFPMFNTKAFSKVYSWLEDYIYGELCYHHYVPVYPFRTTARRIRLSNNFIIRHIKPEELVEISIHDIVPKHVIPFLTYVIEFTSKFNQYEDMKHSLDHVITSLRLYKPGRIGCNMICTTPLLGDALGISFAPTGRQLGWGADYTLIGNETSKIRYFCNNFIRLSEKIKLQKSLSIAIDRFNKTFEDSDQDKIIDLDRLT